ncbi:MAG: endonuclease MutS2 [Halanaerobiales bacterium]|nr:endonuclease MutS2 [Halanaerobiales bacterium]
MEQHTLKVLEYSKIIGELRSYASSKRGKDLVDKLQPYKDLEYIIERLKECSEARLMLDVVPNIPLGGIRDLREILLRAEKGMALDGHDLLDVSNTLFAVRRLKNFFMDLEDDIRGNNPYPRILKIGKQIVTFKPIEMAINQAIDNGGEVLDSASLKLRSIRSQMRTVGGRIKEKLNSIISGSTYQKMIQDAIVTIRGDRYVVPIKSEYKGSFAGIIHDRSSSGQTLFIEPMAVVNLNNQLRQLAADEEEEVYRILKELTNKVVLEIDRIKITLVLLAELDFIFARALYSRTLNAVEPVLNNIGLINLKQARHPSLKVKPVPIDVRLGDGFNTLVITGPNTGGKTVTLKTVGLLTLMAQSGLHVPCKSGSEMSIFEGIYADIGDEQSIEQSLSTFSSHMTQIIKILEKSKKNDLVLFDELGAGTDPAEGASLAMAILDYLHQKDILTIATTHYSELKSYAYSENGVENASVEFDLETLTPTYRLIMGIPGRSNALEIALRLGLPKSIIDHAREGISNEEVAVDKMIKDIEENNIQIQKERLETRWIKREMEELKVDYEKQVKQLEEQKKKILAQALEEAKEIVNSTKEEAKDLIKKARNVHMKNIEQTNLEIKQQLKITNDKLAETLQKFDKSTRKSRKVPVNLELGDRVRILSLNQKGDILEKLNEEEYVVQAGIMKVTVNKKDLDKIEDSADQGSKKRFTKIVRSKSKSISSTLDLRGARYEDARERTDKYLDDAYLSGLKVLEIIHGKGTGALREGIHDLLKGHHHVDDFRLGNDGEGGVGVTIVKLRS